MSLDLIQALSPLFARIGFKNPVGSAVYYTLLIENFPTSFKSIRDEAKNLMAGQIRSNQVRTGKLELLQHGFLAQVLPIMSQDINFDRELFLPISPHLIWKDSVILLDKVISPEELDRRSEVVNKLQLVYIEQFRKYGIGIETGSITIFHSSRWLLYTLVNNMPNTKNISILLGSLALFRAPYLNYYEQMLEKGIKMKIIYDKTDSEHGSVSNIIKLKDKYITEVEIKSNPVSYGTSRKFICDNMVIDSKKLLGFENSDLSYVSTIYLQKDLIERLRKNFKDEWKNASNIQL